MGHWWDIHLSHRFSASVLGAVNLKVGLLLWKIYLSCMSTVTPYLILLPIPDIQNQIDWFLSIRSATTSRTYENSTRSVVWLSVCRSQTCTPAKTTGPTVMPLGKADSCGSREPCIRWGDMSAMRPFHKLLWTLVCNPADRQTDKPITKPRQKHNLLVRETNVTHQLCWWRQQQSTHL